jgi:hypothetical protein
MERLRGGSIAVLSSAALGLSMTGGCSWIFTKPLPTYYSRYDYIDCSTNRAPPVLDTLLTLTNVASAIYVAGQDNVKNKGTAVSLGLSVATLWALSAGYGYAKTSECEQAIAEQSNHYYSPRPRVQPRPRPYPQSPPTTTTVPAAAPASAPAPAPAAPAQAPSPPGPVVPQQQDDDDDPGFRPPPPHRPRPMPVPLDAPRSNG